MDTRVHPVTYQAKLEELVFSLRQAVLSMHTVFFYPFQAFFQMLLSPSG